MVSTRTRDTAVAKELNTAEQGACRTARARTKSEDQDALPAGARLVKQEKSTLRVTDLSLSSYGDIYTLLVVLDLH